MPAHSESSASGWSTVPRRGCSTCATGVSPATSNALPRATDKSAPRVGQIWCIEESIFSPVAKLLGQTMPVLMAASVTSFTDDRASKPRPCLIYEDTSSDESYLVYLFGTFNGGKIKYLPQALQFFLAQVDPHSSASRPKNHTRKRLPCLHASPRWEHHPQFLVALSHETMPGFGFRRVLNHLDRPWTNCDNCAHEKTYWGRKDTCPTFEFSRSQREELDALAARKMRQWQSIPQQEMESMTMEFRICLDAKIGARARDNESTRSLSTIATDFASERTRLSGNRIEPALPPISEEPVSHNYFISAPKALNCLAGSGRGSPIPCSQAQSHGLFERRERARARNSRHVRRRAPAAPHSRP
ncbi:hypothetical protein PENSPDRAFT_472251 [Peniophora sp. CONT]|nr:hypothetical protein PENSPDRAFT_472251 [Peniophora sp. CONT]